MMHRYYTDPLKKRGESDIDLESHQQPSRLIQQYNIVEQRQAEVYLYKFHLKNIGIHSKKIANLYILMMYLHKWSIKHRNSAFFFLFALRSHVALVNICKHIANRKFLWIASPWNDFFTTLLQRVYKNTFAHRLTIYKARNG